MHKRAKNNRIHLNAKCEGSNVVSHCRLNDNVSFSMRLSSAILPRTAPPHTTFKMHKHAKSVKNTFPLTHLVARMGLECERSTADSHAASATATYRYRQLLVCLPSQRHHTPSVHPCRHRRTPSRYFHSFHLSRAQSRHHLRYWSCHSDQVVNG